MAWAFRQRVGSPMAKLALLALADHHNDETGTDPFPAIETIAAETEMNERSVRRHLDALEAAGLIARRSRGRGKCYRLSLPPKPDTESGEAPSSPPTTPDSVSSTPDSLSVTPDSVSTTPDTESTEPEGTNSNREGTGEKARTRADRANRLSDDWQPSQADINFAREEGLDDGHIQRTADRFRDCWIAQPDARARKLDWSATWRNWVRKDAEQMQGPGTARAGDRPMGQPHAGNLCQARGRSSQAERQRAVARGADRALREGKLVEAEQTRCASHNRGHELGPLADGVLQERSAVAQ